MRLSMIVLGLVVTLGVWMALPGRPAHGAAFIVDSTTDSGDASPGDGVCASAAGECTLRAAVQEANELAGPDSITIPAGTYALTLAGPDEDEALSGDLDVIEDLVLTGAGPGVTVIDGLNQDRVIDTATGPTAVSLEVRDLTVQNGAPPEDVSDGGGINVRRGSLRVSNVEVLNSRVEDQGGGIAVFQDGTLVIEDSLISGNVTQGAGGGVSSKVPTTVERTRVTGNRAELGGGIHNQDAPLTIADSTIDGNTALSAGGGVRTFRTTGTLTNATVSGNVSETSGQPAGVDFSFADGSVVRFSTIANNTGAGLGGSLTDASAESSIIAGNSADDCRSANGFALAPAGENLDSDGSCGFSITGNPQLGGLADNGGPTPTHGLTAGSPAIDAATGQCPAADQRGVARPQGSACDLGAYEAEPVAVPEPGPTRTLNLLRGFALLGWTGPDTPVADAIADIADAIGGVWTWDQQTESFRFFGPTAPVFLNTLDVLRYGDGFWILLTRDVAWEMPVWLP